MTILSPFLLPLAIETITLKNCSLTLHQDQQQPSNIIIDGRFDLGFLEQPHNSKLLTTVSGQIETRGEPALTGAIDLKSVDNGYEAIATLSSLQFRQNNLLFTTTAAKQPITLLVSGNLVKSQVHSGQYCPYRTGKGHLNRRRRNRSKKRNLSR